VTEPQPDITVSLPIYIRLGKSQERFSLNLNVYRNAHFHTLNNAKARFEALCAGRINHIPVIAKADLTYRLFFGSRRAIDVSNICCIVDKFFCDTLVNQKKLIDDNMDSISNVAYRWGGIDLRNPRVEVTLSNIQTVEDLKPMQIILTQQEVEDAIRDAVLQQITLKEDQGIAIAFQGLSKEGSLTVSVIIQKADEAGAIPRKRTRRTTQPEESIDEPAKAHVSEEVTTPIPAMTQPIFAQPNDPATVIAEKTSKIFPDINTSAPVQTPAPVATPSAGKSLFSNLTKPVHDPAQE
jgi:hypothetical protein